MPKKSGLKIGSCVLAVVLLGAAMIEASVAEETRSGKTSVKPMAHGHLHARPILAPAASERVMRNAIGVAIVVQHEGVERHDGERHDFPSAVQSPAARAIGVAGSGTGGLAKAGADFGRQRIVHPNAGPTVTATALNRATIGGTGVIRPHSGPSTLGGPAKAVVGINGTAIRPKH